MLQRNVICLNLECWNSLGIDSCFWCDPIFNQDFPGGLDGKVSAYNAGDLGLIPGLGRSSGEGNGSPFQYSCLENPMDGGVW